MIVDPIRDRARLIPYDDCRRLPFDFGLVGATLMDPANESRFWMIEAFYLPLYDRYPLQGIRARCSDQKGFTAFIHQLDLEVLIGEGTPGEYAPWGDHAAYEIPGSKSPHGILWVGFAMNLEDEADDLFERELELRHNSNDLSGRYLQGRTIQTRVHVEAGWDRHVLWECVQTRGLDMDIEDIWMRWKRLEEQKITW